jgi:hypothetical protein
MKLNISPGTSSRGDIAFADEWRKIVERRQLGPSCTGPGVTLALVPLNQHMWTTAIQAPNGMQTGNMCWAARKLYTMCCNTSSYLRLPTSMKRSDRPSIDRRQANIVWE